MKKFHELYFQALLNLVDRDKIKKRQLRVLVDPVNGAASELLPELLNRAGVGVVKINWQMNQLPKRAPEPRKESLIETAKEVVRYECDLGLATDMDADRVLFIDEKGQVLSEDLAAAIFVREVLREERGACVTPFNSSGLFRKTVEENKGRLVECLVGPPEISAAVKRSRAVFAYEESGKYFFCRQFNWPDGLLAGLKMLDILAKTTKTLSQIAAGFPVYYQVKLAVECPWEKMPQKWIGKGEKKIIGDSYYFIRASGTEPLIRIFADSPNQKTAKELAEQGKKIVKDYARI